MFKRYDPVMVICIIVIIIGLIVLQLTHREPITSTESPTTGTVTYELMED